MIVVILWAVGSSWGTMGLYLAFCHRDEICKPGEFLLGKPYIRRISISVEILGNMLFWPFYFLARQLDSFELGLRLRTPLGKRRKRFLEVELPLIVHLRNRMFRESMSWSDVATMVREATASNDPNTVVIGLALPGPRKDKARR